MPAEPTIEALPTSVVATYERVQCRARRDECAVQEYAEGYRASVIITPLWVAVLPDGTRLLIDGNHRLDAALEAKQPQLNVQVFIVKTRLEALRLAIKRAKEVMGLRFTKEDRQSSAEQLLRLDSRSSSRSIGNECGLSGNTVEKIRARLIATAQIEQSTERKGADGRTTKPNPKPATKPSKPAKKPAEPKPAFVPQDAQEAAAHAAYEALPDDAPPASTEPAWEDISEDVPADDAPRATPAWSEPDVKSTQVVLVVTKPAVATEAEESASTDAPWSLENDWMDLHTELERVRRRCPARDVREVAKRVDAWVAAFKGSSHVAAVR